YPEAECALVHEDRFQLLIAVVLSAQTTDKSVNQVTPALFGRYPDAATLASAQAEDLEEILKRIGMYRTKAKNIIALSKMLMEKHGGQVPGDYDLLTELPGVGRKTANVVLSVGFGEPRIAVDTHVFRLANRIGITAEKNVLDTELSLMKAIPREYWIMMHHALIWHGRQVCSARNPKCSECAIESLCRKNNVEVKA
ncbi:MAG: endonuclease III, partial [Clostridiales bacterium]|nr:endonuclease III [Clostridiales bacterium]